MTPYSAIQTPRRLMKELGQKLKVIRKQKQYSQVKLSKLSGVSLSSLRRFEQTGQASLENLLQLSHSLGHLEDFDRVLQPIEDLAEIEKLFDQPI